MLRFISAQVDSAQFDPTKDVCELRKDGKLFFVGTEYECWADLHKRQSQSVDWAMKYEGWTITTKNEDWRDSYNWYAPKGT